MAGRFRCIFPFPLATQHRNSLYRKATKHHVKKSFRDEYIAKVEKFAATYDLQYVFKTGEE
jgi:hypothetical protein